MTYTFHVLGVSTTQTNKKFSGCPYTTNARHLITLLVNCGHTVKHYANVGSTTAAEDIYVTPPGFLEKFGAGHERQYHADPKPPILTEVGKDFSIACANALRKNVQPGDFVVLPSDGTGLVPELISDKAGLLLVESNVGYLDPIVPYRIFHTHTSRSAWRGRANRAHEIQQQFAEESPFIDHNPVVMVPIYEPRWLLDTVIPPFFDPTDFTYAAEKDDYFLFLGRIIPSKGIQEAIRVTEELGRRLILAGPGDFQREFGDLPKHVTFFGMANLEERGELLSKAACLLALTRYDEPCGYIVPEAGFSGTPVITANAGGFTETVRQGVNGFRGECLAEWVEWGERLSEIQPQACRDYALQHFTVDAVVQKYERFWKRIQTAYVKNDLFFTYAKGV